MDDWGGGQSANVSAFKLFSDYHPLLCFSLVDRGGVDVLKLDGTARMIGGLVNVAIIFTSQYYLFLIEAAVFGTCMGKFVCQ